MSRMVKRKALNVINEDLESSNTMEVSNDYQNGSDQNHSRPTTTTTNRRRAAAISATASMAAAAAEAGEDGTAGDGEEAATATLAMYEKRKRISKTFNELSQLADREMGNTTLSSPDMSQSTQSVKKSSSSKLAGKAGIIERVYLKNFKCHSLLEFQLHKYINFILGRNGSGKSAVMDAIVLCLGGKTSCTGRQASAKTFIKTNCDKAELSVTLRNEGADTYRHDLYGSKIIIERKLTKDGQSQYKIMNENSKTVSTKKSELDNIVEQFNIQIDNPVCFLNQETSKHFLASSSKTDKYKLFLKASQLDTMRRMHELIESERKASETLIEEKSSHLPVLEKEVQTWEEKYKKCQSVEKLRQKLSLLIKEYSWAMVIACEKTVENSEKEKRNFDKSKEKHLKKIDEHNDLMKAANEKKASLTQKINTFSEQSRGMKANENKANENLDKAQQAYRSTQAEIKKIKQLLGKKQRDKNELIEKLNEDKKTNRNDYEDEKRAKEEQLADVNRNLNDLQAKIGEKGREAQRCEQEIEQKKKLQRDKDFEIKNYERNIKNCEDDISKCMNAKKDQIYKFGDYMPALVNDIKRMKEQGKFKYMPRGPIGMHIEPRSSEWSLAIEQCLGPLILSFICGSYDDERLMHALIAKHVPQVNKRPRVIVADFSAQLYDVQRYRPENRQYPTVYEMIKCDDPVVSNTLFDMRKIESILLLPDRDVGRHMIEKGNCGANCQEAFLKNGDQLLGKPSYRAYACQLKAARIFIDNPDQVIQLKKREIEKNKELLVNLKADIDGLKEQVATSIRAKSQLDRQLDSLKREQLQLTNKLRQIESIVVPEPLDIAVFEDEINRLEREIEDGEKQIVSIEASSNGLREDFERAKNEVDKYENEKKDLKKAIDEIKAELDETLQDYAKHQEAVKYYTKFYDEIIGKENVIDARIANEKTSLDNALKTAEQVSPRIEVTKSSVAIDKEIQALERQIKQSQNLHENEQEITKIFMEKKSTHRKILEDIKKNNKFLKMLAEAMRQREAQTHQFTEAKSLRCAMDFNRYASARQYNGSLVFNHQEEKLDIIVNPSKSRERDANDAHDLKSLSGGERSFSTVAFLLSLWSIVESPVLFLDEFDVFMDQINRTYAMDLILSAAKEALNGQYVFLTPQEMGPIKPDAYVKMFKMPDPKRSIDMVGASNRDEEEN